VASGGRLLSSALTAPVVTSADLSEWQSLGQRCVVWLPDSSAPTVPNAQRKSVRVDIGSHQQVSRFDFLASFTPFSLRLLNVGNATPIHLGTSSPTSKRLRLGFLAKQWTDSHCIHAQSARPFAMLVGRYGIADAAIWQHAWQLNRKCQTLPEHRVVQWRAMLHALSIGRRGGRFGDAQRTAAVECVVCGDSSRALESHEHSLFECAPVHQAWLTMWQLFAPLVENHRLALYNALSGVLPRAHVSHGTAARRQRLSADIQKKWNLAASAMLYVVYRQYLAATRDAISDVRCADSDVDSDDSECESDSASTDNSASDAAASAQRSASQLLATPTLLRLWRINWSMVANAHLCNIEVPPRDHDSQEFSSKQQSLQTAYGFDNMFTVSVEYGRWSGRWTSLD